MTDEHLRNVNYYFSVIKSLEQRKQNIIAQLESNEDLMNKATYEACKEYAQFSQFSKQNIDVLQEDRAKLTNCYQEVAREVSECGTRLFNAGEFDTKRLTKYLAGVLTSRTGLKWLPVRYLLKPATSHTPQVEGYGLFMADALLTLPGLTDTMTVLDNNYMPFNKTLIKYREGAGKITYTNTENMDNIWMFSSQNFISIGAGERFNAFFNCNTIMDKPYLHLCLNDENVKLLPYIAQEGDLCYPHYKEPNLPDVHPRQIAGEALADLVDARLSKQDKILEQSALQM